LRVRGAARGLRAVMLAGGKGVRLHPFTVNFPKPLVPLGDTPIIEVLMKRLVYFGITDITLTLGHLAELIRAYFLHREEFTRKLNLHYVNEKEPAGTAGSLAFVQGLNDTFLVMNGDVLTDLDFDELVTFHKQQGAVLTVAAHARCVKIDLGVLEFDKNWQVTSYREKPENTHYVSMGIYVYEPRALRFIEPGQYLDVPDLVLRLIAAGERVCARPFDCTWLDVGRPDDYALAQQLFVDKREVFDLG
jgi:NDP-mannose synthase